MLLRLKQLYSDIKGDKVIWLIVIFLSLISLLAVYSAVGNYAYRKDISPDLLLLKQIVLIFFGFVLIFVTHRIPFGYYASFGKFLIFLSIFLLIFTLFFGKDINNARRWIQVPFLNFTFQTSDIAKLSLLVYLATVLSDFQKITYTFKETCWRIILPIFLVCGLILPANLSTALLLFAISSVLLFIGRVKWSHYLGFIGITVLSGFLFLSIIYLIPEKGRIKTWKARIERFTENKSEKKDLLKDYQVKYAKLAIASGYPLGKGPGNSNLKNFLAEAQSDFIFAIIIEEYGIFGAFVVIALFLSLLFRCLVIVIKVKHSFAAFLVAGLVLSLVFQAFIHMAVNVNLLPVTGLTLPLVSSGGSSILFTCIALGIILSVSRELKNETQDQQLNTV